MVDRRGKAKIVQVINYYPFGGLLDDTENEKDVQIRKYGGNELDRMHGLDLYDYSARQYDPVIGQFTSMDPLCEKYYHISPYAYCAGNPVRYVDNKGKAIETAWDIANVAIDITSLSNNIDKCDYASATVDAMCLVGDGLAAAVPFIPGGIGSAVKASRAIDNVSDATTAARHTFQENIRAGKEFEAEMLQKSIDQGLEVYDQVLLVPLNGLGNIKGNRTYVDQLIHNSDGTWTIVETKLSNHTPLSKGQRRAMLEVEEGNGMFEVRSAHHDYFDQGQQIHVYDW
jgi:RHS repeat-associated protein